MDNKNQKNNTVVVVGAGASGLAAAYALRKCGVSVRIVDKASRAGDAWYHRHPQLCLNTHRQLSHLPGMKIPKAAGAFPSRNSIIQYLDNYARQLDVPIDFGVTVERIERTKTQWKIITDAGIYTSHHVVVATGYDRLPFIPDWPGQKIFKKKLIHAADFGELANYHGKKILVVGAGNSGTDILNHLASIEADKLWVSVRHGPVVFPTRLYGVPVQRLSVVLSKLPVSVVDKLLTLTETIAFGNLRKWGLRKHPQGSATRLLQTGTAPAVDNGFIAALKAGKIEIVPEIRRFKTAGLELINGQYIEPDIVIAATGYRTGLESMLGHMGVLNDTGVPTIHGVQQREAYPGLWFTGMRPRLPGFFHMAGETAREIASTIVAEQRYKGCSKKPDFVTSDKEVIPATDVKAA